MGTVKKTEKQFHEMWKELKKEGFVNSWNRVEIYMDSDSYHDRRAALLSPRVYKIVKKHWGPRHAPFVMEALYMLSEKGCARHSYENLYGMALVDCFSQEQTDGDMAVRRTLLAVCSDPSYCMEEKGDSAYNMRNMKWRFFEKAKNVALKMNGLKYGSGCLKKLGPEGEDAPAMQYFDAVTGPILKTWLFGDGIHELFGDYRWYAVAEKLGVPDALDREVVQFLIDDAVGYYAACDSAWYNPYWVYGSRHFDKVWKKVRGIYKEGKMKKKK